MAKKHPIQLFSRSIKRLRPDYLGREIARILPDKPMTFLDLGCGGNSVLQRIPKEKIIKSIGIDAFLPSIEISRRKKIHNEYLHCNLRLLSKYFPPKSVDCVICIDVIEHLPSKEAKKIITQAESISKKLVVFQTTNGFIHQEVTSDGNEYQKHLSGFSPDYFKSRHYIVKGMDGPKFLRVDRNSHLIKSNFLISVIANLLDPIFRYIPQYSVNFLAYKYI